MLDGLPLLAEQDGGWQWGLGKSPFTRVLGRQLRETALMTSQEPIYECWVTEGLSQKWVKTQQLTDSRGMGFCNRLPVQVWLSLGTCLWGGCYFCSSLLPLSRLQECLPGVGDCSVEWSQGFSRLSWRWKKIGQDWLTNALTSDVHLSLEKQV